MGLTSITFVGHAEIKRREMMFVLPQKRKTAIYIFNSIQKNKLKAKKAYQLKKSKDISKDLEDSLLGPEESPSTTPVSTSATSSVTTLSSDKSTSSDPLLLILERLDSMQGRLSALEKGSTSVCLNEVNKTEATPTEGSERRRNSSCSVFAVTEDDEDT